MESHNVSSAKLLAVAMGHHQAGRLVEAEVMYRHLLDQEPANADALQLLGTLVGQKGDFPGAEKFIRKSLEIEPNSPYAYFNLGEFLRRMGRSGEALATIVEGMRYRPSAVGYDNMAMALLDLKCPAAAADALRTALKFDPAYSQAKVKLVELEQVPLGPNLFLENIIEARVCVALCAAATHLHRYEEAIAAAERATHLNPKNGDPLVNLGWLYAQVGRLNDAAAACERAIALDPENYPAHLNLGVIRLLQGNFERGWALYESRKKCPGFNFAKYPQPAWDGKPLHGKRILLWFEQGLGDSIQFLRYVPQVQALGGKVLLAVQPELRRLVQESVKCEEIVDPAKGSPPVDVQCALMSLGFVLGTRADTIPNQTPYLHAPGDPANKWKERLTGFSGKLKIGLSWAGRPGHINDANRSMTLADLAPLASTGAALFSLQKWKTGFSNIAGTAQLPLVDWTNELTDLADTAGLIANLDLVISVDSAIAHLAGAMNKPVWIMLPKAPDWRWLLEIENSPWYPSAKLFRQDKLGDWRGVIAKIADEIQQEIQAIKR